jgi:hypothetical protein
MKTPPEIVSSLTDFDAWRAGSQHFDMIDYAMCVTTPDLLCMMLELADPELVLHDGDYFLAHHFDAAVHRQWCEQLRDSREVQRVMNHIHLSSLLQNTTVADHVAVHLANRLAALWSLVLRDKGLVAEAEGTGLTDAAVTFHRAAGP